ncbi:uncharacterized protein DUF1499 [Onishia taeanensis]|uniref:Uncharacterized protein DUF1499 n=1 Tax=Onishia taeanensis TaxID=284577 RepID=A0A328XVW2_9GAMM|nr:DUF1499 domain-containing protein [Halomonas taeanensis]RAR59810.1 uncharacterized protein DUF1499 [Halomonas taeanensis]
MASSRFKSRPRGGAWPVRIAWLGVVLLVAAAALMAGSGSAYRWDWVSLSTSFSMLRQGAHLAIGAGALGLVTALVAAFCRRWRPVMVGLLTSTAVVALVALPAQMMQRAQTVPPIHDITTDLDNPPAFEALAAAREAAPNEVAYPQDFADQQRAAYGRLHAITLPVSMAEAMAAVKATVEAQGWDVATASDSRLEATATTRWFGFKDDVAIRLTQTDAGVQVDMRSASRIGKSDLGTNAARIQDFLVALDARVAAD